MTGDTGDEIRREHAAILWALAVLTEDRSAQVPVYRAMGGRPASAWIVTLSRACELLADLLPRFGADDFAGGALGHAAPAPMLTRAAAADRLRAQLADFVSRHSAQLAAAGDDDDLTEQNLEYLDGRLRDWLNGPPGDDSGGDDGGPR